MGWYKQAMEITDFEDRNVVNAKIKFLKNIIDDLEKISKLVYQNAKLARSINRDIWQNKKLSSHPLIIDVLMAADEIALDSPNKFATYCHEALGKLRSYASKLICERNEFGKKKDKVIPKGWV